MESSSVSSNYRSSPGASNDSSAIDDNAKSFLGYRVMLDKAVDTTKHFKCVSCLCERENAAIRNMAVCAIKDKDTAMVACRYLQARQGQRNSFYEGFAQTVSFAYCGLTVTNTLRYKKTKRGCKTYLVDELGIDNLREIRKLKYTKDDLVKLKGLMDKQLIKTEELQFKIERKVWTPLSGK